ALRARRRAARGGAGGGRADAGHGARRRGGRPGGGARARGAGRADGCPRRLRHLRHGAALERGPLVPCRSALSLAASSRGRTGFLYVAVFSAGLVVGCLPGSALVLTSPLHHGFTNTEYGQLFLAMIAGSIGSSRGARAFIGRWGVGHLFLA